MSMVIGREGGEEREKGRQGKGKKKKKKALKLSKDYPGLDGRQRSKNEMQDHPNSWKRQEQAYVDLVVSSSQV